MLACGCLTPNHAAQFKAFVRQIRSQYRLGAILVGTPPAGMEQLPVLVARDEHRLYERFRADGIPGELRGYGVAGPQACDMLRASGEAPRLSGAQIDWQALFGEGLAAAVACAIDAAGGIDREERLTRAERARRWFIEHYPLLGTLAAGFTLIEDHTLCHRMGISVAAVDVQGKEIYVNPGAGLQELECRFVLAHALLHVGLRHDLRRGGRDPFIWNVACDYVINDWLVEMGVGALPALGVLYDPALKGESAEAIYDRIATDLRRARKLATLHGVGMCDILERSGPGWWQTDDGMRLDEFYRRALAQGLEYHQQSRGYLPAGLVEEIRALAQPPVPWEVELARWFNKHFAPLEPRRSYARASHRQSSTPEIPRPRWLPAPRDEQGRTFGVLLDTSGSMDRHLLATALGAIASYSIAHEVPAARVVFCDAAAYDQGYLAPEAIADRVQVKGRGGTVLQPGIDLLERADDFPPDGPLLIITDGCCDRLRIRREHAFLIPQGCRLPFQPAGDVFKIR